jgi:hypothetical protein
LGIEKMDLKIGVQELGIEKRSSRIGVEKGIQNFNVHSLYMPCTFLVHEL